MNRFLHEMGDESSKSMSNLEVTLGFIDVANEAMCRPIRALTQVRVQTVKLYLFMYMYVNMSYFSRQKGMIRASMCWPALVGPEDSMFVQLLEI